MLTIGLGLGLVAIVLGYIGSKANIFGDFSNSILNPLLLVIAYALIVQLDLLSVHISGYGRLADRLVSDPGCTTLGVALVKHNVILFPLKWTLV